MIRFPELGPLDYSSADLDRIRLSGLLGGSEFWPEIGSTNDRAAELAEDPATDCPFLVLAGRQTAGRGRGANRWWSAPGALTFSVVVDAGRLDLPAERWPQAALAAGIAMCDAIEPLVPGTAVRVKWPNDVYLDGKKAAGILVEAPALAAGRFVIGIGLNVNNRLADAPLALQAVATSMSDAAGRPFDRTDVLLDVLGSLARWLADLAGGGHELFERWRSFCLLSGKRVRLEAGSRRIAGICCGIDDAGRLLLATEEGTHPHHSGTIVSFD